MHGNAASNQMHGDTVPNETPGLASGLPLMNRYCFDGSPTRFHLSVTGISGFASVFRP
jgi:hypothetical protein